MYRCTKKYVADKKYRKICTDVQKNMWQIKSYDGMSKAIKTLKVQKVLKIRILRKNVFAE